MRVQRVRQGLAQPSVLGVDQPNLRTLQRLEGGEGPDLAQPLLGAAGKFKPRGICAVDDVEIVIAGQEQHELREFRVGLQCVEELRPLARETGVGHVAGNQNEVQRILRVNPSEFGKRAAEPSVALRSGPSAFDPEAVALADNVDVREVCDAPGRPAGRSVIEGFAVQRLRQVRVGDAPEQRGRRDVARDQHDAVVERCDCQPVRRHQV